MNNRAFTVHAVWKSTSPGLDVNICRDEKCTRGREESSASRGESEKAQVLLTT